MKNKLKRRYLVNYDVHMNMETSVEAESEDNARQIAEEMDVERLCQGRALSVDVRVLESEEL